MLTSPLPSSSQRLPSIVTAGGWARSGKGTSMTHLKSSLELASKRVELIDQGIKFRAMGAVATGARQPLDSPALLDDFIRSPKAQEATLAVLDEVEQMDAATRKARLFTPEISKASGRVGRVPSAHAIAAKLLRSQVQTAVETEADVIIIDGRSMEDYAHQFTKEGLAKFVIGWFFKCDPAIAARRSLGLFDEVDAMEPSDWLRLLRETMNISDRNRSDILRNVDPLHEPMHAYHLDLLAYSSPDREYTPYKISHDILHRHGLAVVDTSYTNSIEEMTGPVTELSSFALMWRGTLSHQDVGIQTVTG